MLFGRVREGSMRVHLLSTLLPHVRFPAEAAAHCTRRGDTGEVLRFGASNESNTSDAQLSAQDGVDASVGDFDPSGRRPRCEGARSLGGTAKLSDASRDTHCRV